MTSFSQRLFFQKNKAFIQFMSKTPVFPGNTLRVMMTENSVFRLDSSLMTSANVSTHSPGARAPGVDSCFLWLNTRLDTICLNTESLSHIPALLMLCLFSCLRLGPWQTPEESYPGLYLCSEESLTMENAMFHNKWAFHLLGGGVPFITFYSQNNR